MKKVKLEAVADELYGLPSQEFTAARNARVAAAREAGDGALAASLQGLRKPSTVAWVANQLVREQPREIEHLIELGVTLRSARNLQGPQIRQATKEKSETVIGLLRQARSLAKRAGQPFSSSSEQELEATLDAAFSDPESARTLREGCLTTPLHYSGLGFGADAKLRGRATTSPGQVRARSGSTKANAATGRRDLDQARREAAQADAKAAEAQQAVTAAAADLKRLQAALTVAQRQATRAHAKATAAQKTLERRGLRRSRDA